MTSLYREKLQAATQMYQQYQKQYNYIAFVRLSTILLAIGIGYKAINERAWLWGVVALAFIIIFFFLLAKHKKIALQRRIALVKIKINEQEIAFLEERKFFGDNGATFKPEHHPYAYDLDIFGEQSVYHYLNRAHTFLGRKLLANRLLFPDKEIIEATQESVKALTPDLAWRQTFMAHAHQIDDSASFYEKLGLWATSPTQPLSKFIRFYCIITPILLITSLGIGYGAGYEILQSIGKILLTLNLVIFFSFIGKINKEKLGFERTYEMLYAFRECILQMELRFPDKNEQASTHIARLSRLLDDLDSVSNILVSIPLNVFSFYHLHRYNALLKWKEIHKGHIMGWLESVAEIEVLCSFANFSYNNPRFVYPTLNRDYCIEFEEVGHPLIAEGQRVDNSITLDGEHFVLLTGSNMSGKSTFLRTLGVNMLLAMVGLPVCARRANIHPLKMMLSMRLSDSLSDGQSYFFAEINRIEEIIKTLEEERCFVLLDEVLRGTNSEDKQYGTIKIIERLLGLEALGVLATHDIEVCKLVERYPSQLVNKCFESVISEGELCFDYKLREGVCKNKNATFLMKKLGIITD